MKADPYANYAEISTGYSSSRITDIENYEMDR